MGIYINPNNGQTKEQFLEMYGKPIDLDEFMEFDFTDDNVQIVCWVDNGPFSAAGVAYSPREREAFVVPTDKRPKQFYKVDTERVTSEGGVPLSGLNEYRKHSGLSPIQV